MTKQKDPAERQREIILAALEVLDEKGLPGLSMESVIARVSLSKGGVYRFYRNKQELIVAVLAFIAESLMPIEPEEAIAWGLPLDETIRRLLFSSFYEEGSLRLKRVHMQLISQLPKEEGLQLSQQESFQSILRSYQRIIMAIIKRDGLQMKNHFEKTLAAALPLGQSLFDGLIISHIGGLPLSEIERRMSTFIDLVINAVVEGERE